MVFHWFLHAFESRGPWGSLGDPGETRENQGPPRDPGEALARFSDQLERWRGLLERMERVDLNVRSNTLLGPFLRLKIGDVARYLVAHTDRHLVQADRASC